MDDGLLKAKLTKTNIPSCNPVDIGVVNKVLMEILEKECENEGGQREREINLPVVNIKARHLRAIPSELD